jgi:histidine triad (HIT) family protein
MNHKLFFKLFERNHKILTSVKSKSEALERKQQMSTTCPFCSIAQGKTKASVVYEDATAIAFMDKNPANIGHTLVIPKEHWENIYEIPPNILAEVVKVIKQVSGAVKKTVNADGISILQLNGRAAGQSVMHFHVHVIPRFRGDSIVGHRGLGSPERSELDKIARKIRENF